MNSMSHDVNTTTAKQTAQQLIVELGKSISNKQRQALVEIFIALDRADDLIQKLDKANTLISTCMDEEQRQYVDRIHKIRTRFPKRTYHSQTYRNMMSRTLDHM